MSINSDNSFNSPGQGIEVTGTGEDTLRLIAGLPVPAGLEQRVNAALRVAPRHGRLLAWPIRFSSGAPWVKATAAAAIVMVVAGGTWSVYSHVEPWHAVKPAASARIGSASEFSGASAIRTPSTLQLPVVAAGAKSTQLHPALHPSQKKPHKKGATAATDTKVVSPAAK